MRIAAYQAPLLPAGSLDAIHLIREQIAVCEREQVSFLCCPEGILGGLADYAGPESIAIESDRLESVLSPLRSETVTTIVGFTERTSVGALFNSAAILHRGRIAGVYRKVHPAIRRSVYAAGTGTPVYTIDGVAFGIVICYDSQFPELVDAMAARGATMLFIPTNNGLPRDRDRSGLVAESRAIDAAHATRCHLWVVRADVAGDNGTLVSDGASGIVDPCGQSIAAPPPDGSGLLVASIPASAQPLSTRASTSSAC